MRQAQNIREAVQTGCKGLIADYDTLITSLKEFLSNELESIEVIEDGKNIRPPTAKELLDYVFQSPK